MLKKTKIKLKDGKLRRFSFFNFPIIEYKKEDKTSFRFFPKNKIRENQETIVYFKVNFINYFTSICIQQWINIVNLLEYDYYFVCDNLETKKIIETEIIFPDRNIKFITSDHSYKQKKFAKKFTDKNWYKAGLAHLTTFSHSKKINAKNFWNIDVDDTLFLAEPGEVVRILKNVEQYAKDNKILCFSLDMWRSFTRGRHWSFGIAYTSNDIDWFDVFKKAEKDWAKNYPFSSIINLDWAFTYLRNFHNMNIQNFYIENMRFMHFCQFGARKRDVGLCYWEKGEIHYPLFAHVLKECNVSKLPIPNDVIKFDSDVTELSCLNFYKNLIKE